MSAVVRVTAPVRPLKLCTAAVASAFWTKAVVAMLVELSPAVGVGAVGVPVNCGEAKSAPPTADTSLVCKVTAPVRELKLVTPAVEAAIAFITNAVEAACVVLVPAVAVGTVGVPLKLGEAIGAPPAPVMSAVVRVTTPWRPLNEVTEFAAW